VKLQGLGAMGRHMHIIRHAATSFKYFFP